MAETEKTSSTDSPTIKINDIYVWTISIIASMGGLLYGFVLGVVNGAVPFLTTYFHLNSIQVGVVVGTYDIGGIIGSLCAGYLSDKYGRKKILKINGNEMPVIDVRFNIINNAFIFHECGRMHGRG